MFPTAANLNAGMVLYKQQSTYLRNGDLMNRKQNILAVILIAVTITTCSSLYGQTTDWVGGGGNSFFSNGLNWSDGVPGPTDAAQFLKQRRW